MFKSKKWTVSVSYPPHDGQSYTHTVECAFYKERRGRLFCRMVDGSESVFFLREVRSYTALAR